MSTYDQSVSVTSFAMPKECLLDDPWEYDTVQQYSGCQKKRATLWAWILTVLALIIGGALSVLLLVKGSFVAGFVIAAIAVAIIVGMWLRVFYKGKKAQLIWSQMEGEKQSLARRMKGKTPEDIELAFRAEQRSDRTHRQRERALQQRSANQAIFF